MQKVSGLDDSLRRPDGYVADLETDPSSLVSDATASDQELSLDARYARGRERNARCPGVRA
jgi:hypothetical protein